MIKLQDLTISYDKKIILDNINLEIQTGEMAVLLGKNGSGKSVLLKSIAGLLNIQSGSINVSIENSSECNIAYVFQKGGLFDSMNVFDNVAFGLRRKGIDENSIDSIVMESIARVGLSGSERKMPSELSGGMQKRVGLARAICLNPDVILYDDPTAGLDPVLSDSIADLMINIKTSYNTTSIVTTHDLKVAEKVSDKILLLYNGRIVFNGKTEEFFIGDNPFAHQFIEGEIEGPIDIY